MALQDSYYKNKIRKRLAGGGNMGDAVSGIGAGVTNLALSAIPGGAAIGAITQAGAGLVDAIDKPDEFGRQSLIGSMMKGNLQGGTIGMVGALISRQENNRKADIALNTREIQKRQREQQDMSARLGANPNMLTGSPDAQYYANGGSIDDRFPRRPAPRAVASSTGRIQAPPININRSQFGFREPDQLREIGQFTPPDTRDFFNDSRAKERGDAAWDGVKKAAAVGQVVPGPIGIASRAIGSSMSLADTYNAVRKGDKTNAMIEAAGIIPLPSFKAIKGLASGMGRVMQGKASRAAAVAGAINTFSTGATFTKNYGNEKAFGGSMGPEDPPIKKPLGAKEYKSWNSVVDYARTKKLSPDSLDHDSKVGYGVLDEYNKANPTNQFDRTRVQDIQKLMVDYRGKSIERMSGYSESAQKAANFYPKKQFGDDFAGYMPGLSKEDNFPGSKTLNWQVPSEYLTEKTPESTTTGRVGYAVKATGGALASEYAATKVPGGKLVKQSSDGMEVQGNTHAQGGVQLPQAEVEGGETIKDNFVYSAQLGFAQQHKPIMKAKGVIEQKPATPERINALRILDQKEQKLALSQEYFKKQNGIK